MFEILLATMIGAVALLWYSTKTYNIAFQKLFAALGILLFAVTFLQGSIITDNATITDNFTDHYTYFNETGIGNDAPVHYIHNVTRTYNFIDDPAGQILTGGNLGLFTIFGFLFFLTLVWFGIDYIGIGMNDLGQIVRRKPPKVGRR